MIDIKTFEVNALGENCYVVSDESGEGVIIDPGMFAVSEWEDVMTYVREHNLKLVHCLLTHTHFDHVMGCHFVDDSLGLKPEGHADDVDQYKMVEEQSKMFFGLHLNVPKQPVFGKCWNEGDCIAFGNHKLEIIHTPGHSKGGVCYYIADEKTVFTGDTLFCGSMGRTDLWGGSEHEIMESLVRLAQLPSDTVAYPGHGPKTIIENEKRWIKAICKR